MNILIYKSFARAVNIFLIYIAYFLSANLRVACRDMQN